MRGDSEREELIRDWLFTGDAQAMVRKAAGSVLRAVREKRYSYAFIGLGGTTLADEALLEDIESELRLFILENRRGIQEKLMLAGHKAGWMLRAAFLQHWLDATRTPKSDPWRYLYKRTADILRESADARIKTGPSGSARGTFYSMARESVDIVEPSEEDISTIVPLSALKKKEQ
jgi:hypothetical protein